MDNHLLACANEAALDVRVGIALGMSVAAPLRYQFREGIQYVRLDIRVGVFVDRDRRGCVRAEDRQQACVPAVFTDFRPDLCGDVDQFLSSMGRHAQSNHDAESIALLNGTPTLAPSPTERGEGGESGDLGGRTSRSGFPSKVSDEIEAEIG